MRVMILGAAGFIGTNLAIALSSVGDIEIVLVDEDYAYFQTLREMAIRNIEFLEFKHDQMKHFDSLFKGIDIVFHLVSTTAPSTSNLCIPQELSSNVVYSAYMLDACVKSGVKRVVFISSGGTVYGKEDNCPISEDMPTYPISSYGVQKITIEKLLYLYKYLYGLDYRVIRLANPYGPYQRPNGMLGAITTFTYKALKHEKILVYGDGTVVRDFIYIDDAVKGIINISIGNGNYRVYNLGSGVGTSLLQVLDAIKGVLGLNLDIEFQESRIVDVPVNYLDVSRYEKEYGKTTSVSIYEGIKRTADFLMDHYDL